MNISNHDQNVNPSPRFTGINIPVEILELEELTLFETVLLSWIDALYCSKHGGCFASNSYLAKKMKNVQENTIAKALTNLRKLGLIEDVSFDGRRRVIRSSINRFVEKVQSNAGLDLNPIGVGFKSNAGLDENPTPSNIDIQDDIQVDITPPTPKKSKPSKPTSSGGGGVSSPSLKKYGDFVELSEEDYEKLKRDTPAIDAIIEEMNDWIGAKGKNPYKSHYHALKQWIRKREQEPSKSSKKPWNLCSDEKKGLEIMKCLSENAI